MILAGVLLAAAVPHDPRCDSMKTPDLIACAQAEHDRADAALNRQWKAASAAARAQGGRADETAANGGLTYSQSLLAAQRAWLAYRDAECALQVYGNAGGHEVPIYKLGCLTQLTRQRTKQLHDDFSEGH